MDAQFKSWKMDRSPWSLHLGIDHRNKKEKSIDDSIN